jgi:sigma-E factor negative regulatory protein RseC
VIKETGRVVAIEEDGVWVETIQQSACQTCVAEKGCGQSLIAKMTGKTTAIRVLPGLCDLSLIGRDDRVVIGIPEHVVVSGTMLIYLLPLLTMITGALLFDSLTTTSTESDIYTALGGLLGLVAGGLIVRGHSHLNRNNLDVQPMLLEQLPS